MPKTASADSRWAPERRMARDAIRRRWLVSDTRRGEAHSRDRERDPLSHAVSVYRSSTAPSRHRPIARRRPLWAVIVAANAGGQRGNRTPTAKGG